MTKNRNDALTAACEICEEFGLSLQEVKFLAADLAGEFEAREDARNEAAWERAYDPETISQREEYYRRQMIAAGRGGQLK